MAAKNMVFVFSGNLAIFVCNEGGPSDKDFDEFLRAFQKQDISKLRSLTVTRGGGPSTAQRKALNDALKGQQLPAAVVSSAAMVRGLVTALSWFNAKIRSFTPDQLDEALEYLEVPSLSWGQVRSAIMKLEGEIGTATVSPRSSI